VVGLVLARDRMMYGTTEGGSTKPDGNNGGTIYRFDPATAAYKGLASFTSPTGYAPRAALIEATDNSLWGTTRLHGEKANNSGTDEGTVYRLAPPLTQ
jgi:uncharacterized repeat protein (TIGR03803 family)